MGERGQVIDIKDDVLTVRLTRTEACAKCRVCTAGMQSSDMFVNAKNLCGANVNDWVNIELENSDFLKAVTIMYGIPCAFLLAGILGGYYGSLFFGVQSGNEFYGFIAGLVLMLISFLIIHSKEQKFKQGNFVPVANKKL